MKIGICAWVLPMPVTQVFQEASSLGLDGIVMDYEEGLRDGGPQAKELQEIYGDLADRYQLAMPTLALNCLCRRGMTRKTNETYAKELIHHAIETAKTMGIDKLQIPSFADNLILSQEDLNQSMAILAYACQLGQDKGVAIGSENVLTISQHRQVMEALGDKGLMTIFDTQNPWRMMNQNGVRIAAYMAPYVGELHAKDSLPDSDQDLCLGQGDVRFDEIMAVFAEHDYRGWVQLESPYNRMKAYRDVVTRDIKHIQSIFTTGKQ